MVAVLQHAVCAQQQKVQVNMKQALLTNAVGWSMHTDLSVCRQFLHGVASLQRCVWKQQALVTVAKSIP